MFKPSYLLLFALCPLALSGAHAQTQPQLSVEPAAQSRLDRTTALYKAAKGLRFDVRSLVDGKELLRNRVEIARPSRLRISSGQGASRRESLADGTAIIEINGTTYQRTPGEVEGDALSQLIQSSGAGSGPAFVVAMMAGQSPLEIAKSAIRRIPSDKSSLEIKTLAPIVLDGELLDGVKMRLSYCIRNRDGLVQTIQDEETLWFGAPNGVLRRAQSRQTIGGRTRTLSDVFSGVELNPTFAPGAWKFNATGLTLAAKAVEDENSFDPRLKVGAPLIPFSAKTLDGKTVSPASFGNKVLILDFWATWCGPCVAALPELQKTYNAHHKQGLEVLGISLDEDKTALTSFVKARKMAWPQVFDGKGWEAELGKTYGVQAIPFVLVVGRDGKIAAVNPSNLESAVKRALAAK